MSPVPLVQVIRSGLEESDHLGDVVAVDPEGRLVATAGDPELPLFARSCMKPLQAIVSLSLGPFDFTDREVAVMCASHNAEPVHLETVRSILSKIGLTEDALQCTPRRPMDEEAAAANPDVRHIHSDCSGKHAGMLAACVAQGWPVESYLDPDHPYQQAVLGTVLATTGLSSVRVGVDGCGAPVHGMPLWAMGRIYARLARPEDWGELAPNAARAVGAMRAEPYMVAGRNRVDTAVMETAQGIVIKAGAEGLLCASILGRTIGVAVKIRDGTPRASGPSIISALGQLGALTPQQLKALDAFARPSVLGGGRPVGELVAEFELSGPPA
jgi:L-asparaginase II